MSERTVLQPGPDHPITVEPHAKRVTVRFDGKTLADTESALTLREASYPPVFYIPLEDVDQTLLSGSDHASYCPYKGEASYFSVGGHADVAWSYADPLPDAAQLAGLIPFYDDLIEVTVDGVRHNRTDTPIARSLLQAFRI